MSAWVCKKRSGAWNAVSMDAAGLNVDANNVLDLEKAIRKTAGHTIWSPLQTHWSMVKPDTAIFVMASAQASMKKSSLKDVVTERSSDTNDDTVEAPRDVSDDDDDFIGGIFD